MLNLADYRFPDVGARFDRAYDRTNMIRTDAARTRAGNALKSGDYQTGAAELLDAGEIAGGVRLQQIGADQSASQAEAQAKREAEALKYTADFATRLGIFHARTKDVNRTLQAFDMGSKQLLALGETPAEIAAAREAIQRDPEGTLTALGAAAKKYQLANGGDGKIGAFDPDAGTVETLWKGSPKPIEMDPEKNYILPEPDASEAAPAPVTAAPAAAPGAVDPDAVWKSIHAQESGGDPTPGDAVGPDTRYGNALGSTQMLPATAEAMARKLGIAWNPALMRENSPKALAYQDALGRAYFDEGLQKSGGDPAAAAAYYFGGPDPKLHGPKTQAYVSQVMARAGAGSQPYEVASNGETPAPPGYRMVQRGRPKAPEWAPDGKGLLINRNGDRKPDPAFAGTPEAGKVTEGERTAGFLSSRLANSLTNLTQISKTDPGARKPGLAESAAQTTTWIGGGEAAANLVRSADRQQVVANQLDVLDAALTLGTGAAYTKEQLRNYQNVYFPNLTDKPETVRAKGQKLISLLEAAKIKAGRSAPPELDVAIASAKAQLAGSAAPAAPAAPNPAAKLKSDPQAVAAGRVAIRRGADPQAVAKRLRDNGIDPAGL